MKKLGALLMVVSLLFFVVCGFAAAQGADKYTNYYNSDTYPELNRNAYVGGDAYNYIINGTYFTAYAVAASGCAVCGLVCLIGGALLIGQGKKRDELIACKQLLQDIADHSFDTHSSTAALPADSK